MTALEAWAPAQHRHATWLRHLLLAGLGIGMVVGLTSVIGGARSAANGLGAADYELIVLAAGLCALTYAAAGVAQRGAVQVAVPLARLVAVQVACAFTNRLLPGGIGTYATNGRFLRRFGLTTPQATAAVGLNGATGALMHVAALVVAVPWLLTHRRAPVPFSLPSWSGSTAALWAALAAALVLLAVWVVRHHDGAARGARAALNATAQTGQAARLVLGDRSKLGQLLGGSVAVTYLHAFAFGVCVAATGGHVGWFDLLAVYLVGTALAALVPTPGNLGAEEAALFLLLTTVGVAAVPALAGVLWFRLVSFWLPTVPGAVAFGFLLHRRRL
jgi:undecaprenyl-diphosphatase